MDKRNDSRWSKRIAVTFWRRAESDKRIRGYTTDISNSGTFITSQHVIGRNARIQMEFSTDRGSFFMEGIVARSVSVPRELQRVKPGGIGVRFLKISELLKEALPGASAKNSAKKAPPTPKKPPPRTPPPVASRAKQPKRTERAPGSGHGSARNPLRKESVKPRPKSENPGDRRPPSAEAKSENGNAANVDQEPILPRGTPTFLVFFASRDELRTSLERDIRQGGLFVRTDDPAPIDSKVYLQIHLPNAETVTVPAQVVHTIPDTMASTTPNLLAGMGVELLARGALVQSVEKVLELTEDESE